jgi:NAD(P)-dependent dehydrogenase (short-subunit alcohol dehydrogenase family)
VLVPGALKDLTIIVTGGGTGLGKSMSRRFAELGANVVIAARNLERLNEAAKEIESEIGRRVVPAQVDVRSLSDCEAMVNTAVSAFGGVDGLVNNAAGNFLCAAEDLSSNGFDAVVDIVMKGSFHATQAVGRRMIAQGTGGVILSIVTSYAWTGSAFVLPSAMAKAGVLTMTRSLAVEWGSAYGIRLNAVAPGPFPTPGAWKALFPDPSLEEEAKARIPLKRFGEHIELANLAAYLMSPYSGFVNGDCITIDGGEWLKGAGEFNRYTEGDRETVRELFKSMRAKKG